MKLRSVFGLVFTASIMSVSVWLLMHQQEITDWWRLRDYSPSPAIAQLAVDSGMNENGERLFYVHAPELLDKSQFNGKCTFEEETIVLGCYISHDKIYVFNVNNQKLAGIEEVTAAHEMLHAAYDRLSVDEKETLDALLLETFQNLNDERLNKTIEAYRKRDPSVISNELHSILGTEVRALPAELEQYYDQYFEDRLAVVELSEAYEAAFTELEDSITAYDEQIASLGPQIEGLQQDIEILGQSIDAERQQLESLRSDPAAFNEALPSYNNKVRYYNAQISELRDLITTYNQLVEERNAIALQEQDLIKSIDSSYQEL